MKSKQLPVILAVLIVFFSLIYLLSFFTEKKILSALPPANNTVTSVVTPTVQNRRTDSARNTLWEFQCIDTMKDSRDNARVYLGSNVADTEINRELTEIKSLGANCVAVDTPYDDEFLPVLEKWVAAARRNNLKVWFRGNWSGWEGWFGYPKFSDVSLHHQKTYTFITSHSSLFEDGDIFTPAPEPENGIIGDPRQNGKKDVYLSFLTKSYDNCRKAFFDINKNTACGYFSVNGDIALGVLNRDTVQKLGNVVVIDHYVDNPLNYGNDIAKLGKLYNAKVIIGEYGAPIPDINGTMTESTQSAFVRSLLSAIYRNGSRVGGVNYWALKDASTALLNSDNSERKVAEVIRDYYQPAVLHAVVQNKNLENLSNIKVMVKDGPSTQTDVLGRFTLILPAGFKDFVLTGKNYKNMNVAVSVKRNTENTITVMMEKTGGGIFGSLNDLRKYFRL